MSLRLAVRRREVADKSSCRDGTIWYCARLEILFPLGYMGSNPIPGAIINSYSFNEMRITFFCLKPVLINIFFLFFGNEKKGDFAKISLSKCLPILHHISYEAHYVLDEQDEASGLPHHAL